MRKFLELFLTVVITIFLVTSASAGPISLMPPAGDKSVTTYETQNFVGSCGKAAVLVLGVTDVLDDSFKIETDSAKVIVRKAPEKLPGSPKQLILSVYEGLSDYNRVACIKTRAGQRLVVWNTCGGSACGDYYFYIIDPNGPTMIQPRDPSKLCDKDCAAKALGGKLPPEIKAE